MEEIPEGRAQVIIPDEQRSLSGAVNCNFVRLCKPLKTIPI